MSASPDQLADYLAGAVEAARRGAALLESWRSRFHVREKARADLVTDADNASQQAIKEYLLGRFPGTAFVGEEESVGKTNDACRPAPGSPPTWVVDPLDGTANYVHDVPAYCVSIGLVVDGVAAVGVIHDPRMNEVFTAARGRGAFLNGKPMRVSTVGGVRDAMLSTGFPASYDRQVHNLAVWAKLSAVAQTLRRTGSTALNLAYVAAGRFDGYWCYDNYAWDVLAGAVLVAEAGGTVTTVDGKPFDAFRPDLIAGTPGVHGELLGLLAGTL